MRKSLWWANFAFIILTAILFWVACDTDLRLNVDQIFILTYPILFLMMCAYLAMNITLNCMTRESYKIWQGNIHPFSRMLLHRRDAIEINVIRCIGYFFILMSVGVSAFNICGDNVYNILMGLTNVPVVWIHVLSLSAVLEKQKKQ